MTHITTKRAFLIFALAVLSLAIETRDFFGVRLDATALLVYYIGLKHGPSKGLLFGAVIGAATDALSGGLLGPGMMGKALVGYLAPLVPNVFFRWTPAVGLLSAFSLTLLDRAVSLGAISLLEEMPVGALRALGIALTGAALNSLAGPFLRPNQAP